ncbi:LOW QUALITY PROTEIN: presenilin-1-like [Halichondria panicea]|uniref:LOW QUALITY PROTEIN: presenilin-1-like n=1 Tax=Halichondria panicea TaxID=6063 RepID=UPI00312B43A7
MAALDSDTDTEKRGSMSEHTGLLPSSPKHTASAATVYASDGETPSQTYTGRGSQKSSESDEEPDVEYAGQGGLREEDGRGRRRGGREDGDTEEDTAVTGEEEDNKKQSCGLIDVWRGFLKLLPEIGDGEDDDSEEFESALKAGAQQIVHLIIPVTICMAIVVLFELTVAVNDNVQYSTLEYLIPESNAGDNSGLLFIIAVANAAIFIVIVIVMTVVLVLLFKYRCYKAIFVWLLVASALLLYVIAGAFFVNILQVHNLVIDWFSFAFFLWNFGAMGLVSIHWKGPLRLQQAYLILTSALVATTFLKYLPDWTTWILLVAISLYDLFAVLCPKGPLRVLVETAKERNQPIFPSLIYSSTMVWVIGMADNNDKKSNKKGDVPKPQPQRSEATNKVEGSINAAELSVRREAARELARSQENPDLRQAEEGTDGDTNQGDDEPRGFKLGLGDFIFYSILVGKAAHDSDGDWVIISSCFVAILIGLCLTTLILGLGAVRRALPALPISIFFGLIFYFTSRYLIAPYGAMLATTQVFI